MREMYTRQARLLLSVLDAWSVTARRGRPFLPLREERS